MPQSPDDRNWRGRDIHYMTRAKPEQASDILENQAHSIEGADRPARIICTCDHATNRVPDDLMPDLGLPREDLERHIAYDVGAAGVTRALAEALDGPAVLSNFSRLVIDPNRGEDDPTLVMRLYDGTIIEANRHVDATERKRRIETLHRPYHDALARVCASRQSPIIVAIHSFTPRLRGRMLRPWHIGLLYAHDDRLARPLLARLRDEKDLHIGDNQPYRGDLAGDAMDRHALQHGRGHVLIELRNDLISTPEAQVAWGRRLAPLMTAAIADAGV